MMPVVRVVLPWSMAPEVPMSQMCRPNVDGQGGAGLHEAMRRPKGLCEDATGPHRHRDSRLQAHLPLI